MKLTIWERVQLGSLVRAQKGDVGLIIDMLPIAKKLDMTDEEIEEIGLVRENEGTFWEHEKTTEIPLSDDEIKILTGLVHNSHNWPVDERVVGLSEKFN